MAKTNEEKEREIEELSKIRVEDFESVDVDENGDK